jgi:hypothetical protein
MVVFASRVRSEHLLVVKYNGDEWIKRSQKVGIPATQIQWIAVATEAQPVSAWKRNRPLENPFHSMGSE